MAADKHFDQTGAVPEALEDHRPDDMPAARTIGVVVMLLLLVCSVITAIIYTNSGAVKEMTPTQQAAPAR